MARAERTAQVGWQGSLTSGSGEVTARSGAFSQLPVTWASRTERSDGRTSPEELIAAAHASCYAMALSNTLTQAGNEPEQLDVTAVCTFDADQVKVTSSALDVRARVPELDRSEFERLAGEAEKVCPVSNALRGNVEISLSASLAE